MNRYLLLLLLMAGRCTYAQSFKYQVTLRDDNDFYFGGDDRYYTNGTFFGLKWVADSAAQKRAVKEVSQIRIGQKMYNPQSGFIPSRRYIDRPFAAYLFAGIAHTWNYKNESVLKAAAEAGVIGPNALGREAQTFIHRLIGQYPPEGWQYQVGNDIALNTSLEYTALLLKNAPRNIDLSASGEALLGTTFSGATAGLLFRAGMLKSFSSSAGFGNDVGDDAGEKEFFFYAGPQLGVVGYDATIQGPLISTGSSRSVIMQPRRFYFSQTFGGVYSRKRWLVDFSLILRSKETGSQVKSVHWASLNLGYRFGKPAGK